MEPPRREPTPPPPSTVVLLTNMVGPGEVDDMLQTETADECTNYGKVERCLIYEVRARGHDAVVAGIHVCMAFRFLMGPRIQPYVSLSSFSKKQPPSEPSSIWTVVCLAAERSSRGTLTMSALVGLTLRPVQMNSLSLHTHTFIYAMKEGLHFSVFFFLICPDSSNVRSCPRLG